MSVGYRRDPRPGSATRSESEALRLANLVAATERIRHQEGNIRVLDDRIRAAVQMAENIQQRRQRAADDDWQIRRPANQSQNQNQDRVPASPVPIPRIELHDRSSWENLLLFVLDMMTNERPREFERGDSVGSYGRVLGIVDHLLRMLLDPAYEDVFSSAGFVNAAAEVVTIYTGTDSPAAETVVIYGGGLSPAPGGGSDREVDGADGNRAEQVIRGRGRGEGEGQPHRGSWERNLEQADEVATASLAAASEAA